MSLVVLPRAVSVDANGLPRVGAKLYLYAATTTTPITAYTTGAYAVSHANPVVSLGAGLFPAIYVNPAVNATFKLVLKDAADVVIYTDDNIPALGFTASDVGSLIFPRSLEEIAAVLTPTNYGYTWGHPRRWGATLDGTTDDTTALQNWATVGGNLLWPEVATAKISSSLTFVSNTRLEAVEGACITTATTNVSHIFANSKSNITIRGMKFKQTATGSSPYIAGVKLQSCTDCVVDDCEFEGMEWAGVMLTSSSRCRVTKNYIHGHLGTADDSNDITVYEASTDNIVKDNYCYGTNSWHGILVQEPYSGNLPKRNIIQANHVTVHKASGIIGYFPNTHSPFSADTFNQFLDNDIEGITGAASTTLYGSGFYLVGYGACGTTVRGNNIRDCCKSTTATVNGQGGLTIAGLPSTGAPVVVASNTVTGMTKFFSMNFVSNEGVQISASNNTVNHPTGNTTGEPVRIEASSNTSFIDGNITVSTASGRRGILVYGNSVAMSNVKILANNIVGGGDRGIETLIAGGGTLSNISINDNTITGGAASVIPLYLASITKGTANGNICVATSTYAAFVSSCTKLTVNGNTLDSSGTQAFGTTGTCTGSRFGDSNVINGFVDNAATGLICSHFQSAAPASGSSTGAVGDLVIQSVPVVGNPKGWRCTVAGAPGTWVSEGVL